mgnify:CR=1 FL=1
MADKAGNNKGRIVFVDRRGTDSCKWDDLKSNFGRDGLQAMWVADMDFRVPDCVIAAIEDYMKTGVFGYYVPRPGYYQAFIDWEREYHGYEIKKEWLRFAPGVVPAFNWLVQVLTGPGDAVIVQTPVYYPFMRAVKNNGRRLVRCDLINNGGVYAVDIARFEKEIIENSVKLFILSSPHNPVGRVWKRHELKAMLDICKKHGVYVISDEIHHDMAFGGNVHIPSATAGDYDEMLVTLTAATKTFNLAGCQNSFVIIPDAGIRRRFDSFAEGICIHGGNPFGYVAVEAAYRGGREWLEQVKDIIYGNYEYVRESLKKSLPKAVVSPLEGTYLLWIDFGAYLSASEIKGFMEERCGLAFDYGDWFGGERFGTHIRMNLATSRELVEKAVSSIISNLE